MNRERLARFRTKSGDDVGHARRQDLLHDLDAPGDRQRRLLGRLQHRGVAGDQRRAELSRGQEQRCVPGNDRRHHAEGIARRVAQRARLPRQRTSLDLGAEPGEQPQHLEHRADLRARLRGECVAGFETEQARETIAFALQTVGHLTQQIAARARRHRRPAGERRVRSVHRPGHVLVATARCAGDLAPIGRILDGERLGAACRAELATDDDLARQPLRVGAGVGDGA
jgi:hypothetical protein